MMLLLRIFSVICLVSAVTTFNFLPEYFRFFIFAPFVLFTLLIINAKTNLPLVLIYIYGFLFYLYQLPKFLFDFPIVYYDQYADIYFYNKALLINLVFLSTIGLSINSFQKEFNFPNYSNWFQPNHFIVLLNVVIMVLILMFGFSGKSITSGVPYGTNDFGAKSIFTEYFIIFLIFAYCHSKNSLMKWGVLFVSGLMVIISVLYGSRISALLIILTAFILHFPNHFSIKKILILVFAGLLSMNLVGSIRQGGSPSNANLGSLLRIKTDGIMNTTQSDMFYGSVCFVGLVEDDIFTTERRVKSFIGFIGRLILPSKLAFEEGSLVAYGQNFTNWGGGAHPATYFYVWFGWGGPILFGLLLTYLLNGLKNLTNNKYIFFMGIILLATFPRWYGYEPGIIFKMTWVGIVILIIQENLFFKVNSIIDKDKIDS